jgi:hypothetical protein
MVKKEVQWLEKFVLLIVVMAGALAMSPSVADPDLWGHVQFGRDVLNEGWFPETNPYSYNAEGFRWINHENFSEVIMAWTVDNLGSWFLVAGKFLLSLFVIGSILWVNAKRQVSLIPNCMIALLVAWNLGYHWSFRPQVSSFVCFTLLVLLLNWAFIHWRDRWHLPIPGAKWFSRGTADVTNWKSEELNYSNFHNRFLWLAPILFFVWANSHGGFVAGVCIFVAYLGCRAIESFGRRGKHGSGLARRMALMGTVAALATLLNPYSYQLQSWLLESLGQPRPEISDWSSDQLFSMIGLKFWALIAVSIGALLMSRKSWDFTHTVILALTLWQAVSHFRHVPFFAILCGFWIGPHLQSAFARLGQTSGESDPMMESPRGKWAAGLVCGFMILLIGFQLSTRLQQINVDRSQYPVDAFQYMHDHDLGGKVVVTYDWAQYVIGAFCTDDNQSFEQPSRVAFDGRFRTCYPQKLVDLHFDWLFSDGPHVERSRSPESGPCDPLRILSLKQPDLVLNRRFSELTSKHMKLAENDWALLYQDKIAQVWGRRSVFDNPESPRFLPASQREISNRDVSGYVAWPAFPKSQSDTNNLTSSEFEVVRNGLKD